MCQVNKLYDLLSWVDCVGDLSFDTAEHHTLREYLLAEEKQ